MAARKVSSVFRPGLFEGKTAVVTGGGTGIGLAITQELLHLGCRVLIASRSTEKLEQAAASIKKISPTEMLELIKCNIRKEEDVKSMIQTVLSKFHKLDFLINNGGGQFPSHAADISLKGWNAVLETNLTGTYLCCQQAYQQWMQDHGGVIINITADVFNGMPLMAHTGAARAGVENLTKTLAVEWASSGVRINAVAPGTVPSPTALANYSEGYNVFEMQRANIPAKRLGTTEEISAAVLFFLSPAAAFISGETLTVGGGQSVFKGATGYEVPDHNNSPTYDWESDAKSNKTEHNKTNSKL